MEYFFQRDKEVDNEELHKRDRNIFLADNNLSQEIQPTRRQLLKSWLAARSREEFSGPEQRSPGDIFEDSLLIASSVSLGFGLVTGLVAGLSFFTYSGTTPVNVFHFLFFFVFSQLTLIGLLAAGYLFGLILPGVKVPSFYSLLIRAFIDRVAFSFHKKWLDSLDSDRRGALLQAFGIVRARGITYGRLFYWPLFSIAQLAGTGFNIALLAVTLFKVSTSDLAFGWQSTLQLSSSAIHQAAKLMALPWSWFVPSVHGYPSLEQIEGSRIILKEGIYHLTTADLVAWWPFLVFCLLFYGLFFRLGLQFLGIYIKRRSLNELQLDTPDCIGVVRRMLNPTVSTQAAPEPLAPNPGLPEPSEEQVITAPSSFFQPVAILVPDDIFDLCPAELLGNLLRDRGYDILCIKRFMVGYEEDKNVLQHLGNRNWQSDEGVLLLMEGWMPPLVDFLSFLGELRRIVPVPGIISLALVGRPNSTELTPVARQDLTIWKRKVEALGDPYLQIFSLIS